MKLNGWQRAGVVLSVLWVMFISAVGFDQTKQVFGYTIGSWVELPSSAFTEGKTTNLSSSTPASVDCGNLTYDEAHVRSMGWTRSEAKSKFEQFINLMADGDERVKAKPSLRNEVLQSYTERYGCRFTPAWYSNFESSTEESTFGIKGIAIYGVGIALLGWLLAYISINAYQWIAAGFKPSKRDDGEG